MTCSLILVHGSYCLQYLHLNILWCMNRWWHWAVSSLKFFTAWIQCVQINFSQSLHTFATLVAPKRSAPTWKTMTIHLRFISTQKSMVYHCFPMIHSFFPIPSITNINQHTHTQFKFELMSSNLNWFSQATPTITISIHFTLIFKLLFRRLPHLLFMFITQEPKTILMRDLYLKVTW